MVGSVRRGRAVGDRRRAEPDPDAGDAGDPAAAVRRRVVQSLGRAAAADRGARHVRVPSAPRSAARRGGARRVRSSRCRGRSSRCSTRRTWPGRSRSCRGCWRRARVAARAPRPRAVRVAIAFALQALCGEPVTWVVDGSPLALGGQVYELAVRVLAQEIAQFPDLTGPRRSLDLTPVVGGCCWGAAGRGAAVPTLLGGMRAKRGRDRDAGLLVAASRRAVGSRRAEPVRQLLRRLPRRSAVDGGAELWPRSVLLLALRRPARAAARRARRRRALPPQCVLGRRRRVSRSRPRSAATRRSTRWSASSCRR